MNLKRTLFGRLGLQKKCFFLCVPYSTPHPFFFNDYTARSKITLLKVKVLTRVFFVVEKLRFFGLHSEHSRKLNHNNH